MEHDALVDGNMATEANMVVLDTLEIIVQVGPVEAPALHLFLRAFSKQTFPLHWLWSPQNWPSNTPKTVGCFLA